MPSNPNPQPAIADSRLGEIVAERYRIIKLAGSGPASTLYQAEDLTTGDAVALKLTAAPAGVDSASVSSYRAELNVFRSCKHPALVRIVDVGDSLGRLYVATEWVAGASLRAILQQEGKLGFAAFEHLYEEITAALADLHTQRLAHRDIHPGNILRGADGRWKLMEFGIHRDQRRTRESADAPYAAPEQIMGQRSSFATDVYSMGAIAYHALLGRPPLRAAMSPVRVEGSLDAAPPEFAAVIETCLQLDPAKRFPNVQALRTATARLLAVGQTASGRPLSEWASAQPANPEILTPQFVRVVRTLMQVHEAGQSHGELSPTKIRVIGDRVLFDANGQNGDAAAGATLMIADAKYTAPELVLARKTPDPASHVRGDVYVLGFVFYELLAGQDEMRRQFADAEQAQSGLAWMHWHADPKSALRSLSEVVPSCPQGVAELIERMTRKDPGQRIQTLEEVADALEKLTFVLARTQPYSIKSVAAPSKRTGKRSRRPAVALVAVGIAAAIWLASGSSVWSAAKARWRLSSSARAAAVPATLETPTGTMVLVEPREGGLPSFYIDQTEVTNREYRRYCAASGRALPEPPAADPGYFGKDDLPVVDVDRDAAASFCGATGKRLPTEQEWEKAAGSGEKPALLWGNWTLPELANLKREGGGRAAKVGSFAADVSSFGMLDAAGNVREWVADIDRSGPSFGVLKGGSFDSTTEGLSPSARTLVPLERAAMSLSDVGFRCAADVRTGLSQAR